MARFQSRCAFLVRVNLLATAIWLGAANFAYADLVVYEVTTDVDSVTDTHGLFPIPIEVGDEFLLRATLDTSVIGDIDDDRFGGVVYYDVIKEIAIFINGVPVPLPGTRPGSGCPPLLPGCDTANMLTVRDDVFLSSLTPVWDRVGLDWKEPDVGTFPLEEYAIGFGLEDFTDTDLVSSQEIPTALDIDLADGANVGFVVTRRGSPGPSSLGLSLENLAVSVFQVLSAVIEIKPGKGPNAVNPSSSQTIPVAVLTTEALDATQVDVGTVVFGPDRAVESHERAHIEDVDDDGDMDLLLHFKMQAAGIECGDTEALLTGETYSDQPVFGSDTIVTVGCR